MAISLGPALVDGRLMNVPKLEDRTLAAMLRQQVYDRYALTRSEAQRRADFLEHPDNQTILAARARHELKELLLKQTTMASGEIAKFMGMKAIGGVRKIRRPKCKGAP